MANKLVLRNGRAVQALIMALQGHRDFNNDTMLDNMVTTLKDAHKLANDLQCYDEGVIEKNLEENRKLFESQLDRVLECDKLLIHLNYVGVPPESNVACTLPIADDKAREALVASLETCRDMTKDTKMDGLPTSITAARKIGNMTDTEGANKLMDGRNFLNESVDRLIELELMLNQL